MRNSSEAECYFHERRLPLRRFLIANRALAAQCLAVSLLVGNSASSRAVEVLPGSIAIGLENEFNTFATGIDGVSVPIDMNTNGDGKLYVASINGQVIVSDSGSEGIFLDLHAVPEVHFTSLFAAGLMGIAFHPDYHDSASEGYRKFYTYSSDLKTVNQNGTQNVSPGNELTGLPDFWHPEMYAPAAGGNPLTNWTNPDSPDPGNTDFDHFNIVREWTATAEGSAIDTNVAPREILRMAHGYAGRDSHNGGGFRFGPDGYLYLSTGDGGGSSGKDYQGSVNHSEDGHSDGTGNGQDRTVVYGKVIRIDPTAEVKNSANGQYGIPADNPYVLDDTNPDNLDEIYAFGFRNPWKLNFDDASGGDGSLYLSDVGQHHREEIDIIDAGGNYGWGYLEGNVRLVDEGNRTGEPDPTDPLDGTDGTPVRIPFEGFEAFEAQATAPLVDYLTRRQTVNNQLVGDGTAVTGGFVYRGERIPELDGMYVFGDLSIGGSPPPGIPAGKARLFYLDPTTPTNIFEFDLDFGGELVAQLLGFGRDDAGELLAMFDNGNVTQIVGSPDRDRSGAVDGEDFLSLQRDAPGLISTWRQHYGEEFSSISAATVPEPSSLLLVSLMILTGAKRRRTRKQRL